MKDNLHKEHRIRVRERFMKEGLEGFTDHEALEMLLFYSIPVKDTNELAHILIDRFGSLRKVMDAHPSELMSVDGIGAHSATLIAFSGALARRYTKESRGKKPKLINAMQAGEYAVSLFFGEKYESIYLICLDVHSRVINAGRIAVGTLNEILIYPRIIVEMALRNGAYSVILAHNHPGGKLTPSPDDIDATKSVMKALETIDIKLIDHIIVSGNSFFSFIEKRLVTTRFDDSLRLMAAEDDEIFEDD